MQHLPDPPAENPVAVAERWLVEARAAGTARNPDAMALASVDAEGRPSARMVLLKALSVDPGYGVFYTHYGSRKARELESRSVAAAVLYWPNPGRQVRFEGLVRRSPPAESDAYFATRARVSQLNAWVSAQSQPLDDPGMLDRRLAEKCRELGVDSGADGRSVPRPPFWGGYRLWFASVELWVEGRDRFHERIRYQRELVPDGGASFRVGSWHYERLQP